jgi:hypothetical protein
MFNFLDGEFFGSILCKLRTLYCTVRGASSMKIKKCLIMILFLLLFPRHGNAIVIPELPKEEDLPTFLNRVFEARTQLLINQEPDTIAKFYKNTDRISRFAFQQEVRRSKYIHAWATYRGVDFTKVENKIRIINTKVKGDAMRVFLINTLQLTYEYANPTMAPQLFGVGTRHYMSLKRNNGSWYIVRDWYSDPIEEDPTTIPANSIKGFPNRNLIQPTQKDEVKTTWKPRHFQRDKAVAYADKYAGAAWGAGNNHSYNPKYQDYTGLGGDCTNFASQVIGDPIEGGSLPMTGSWRYYYGSGASQTWVQTDSFKDFILYSGYGRLIAKGTFSDVVKPTSRFANGAISQLKPGDLIGYEMKGDVDHFCIVTGYDVNGYPLVNSHTGDRFHVPFDLGWDKYTKYLLIHIRD